VKPDHLLNFSWKEAAIALKDKLLFWIVQVPYLPTRMNIKQHCHIQGLWSLQHLVQAQPLSVAEVSLFIRKHEHNLII